VEAILLDLVPDLTVLALTAPVLTAPVLTAPVLTAPVLTAQTAQVGALALAVLPIIS
jgi:hypothetical protein